MSPPPGANPRDTLAHGSEKAARGMRGWGWGTMQSAGDWLINDGATQQECFIFNEAELMPDNPEGSSSLPALFYSRLSSAPDMLLTLLIDAALCRSPLLNASFQKAGTVTLLSSRVYHTVRAQSLGHARLFATPWTVARRAPLSVGFSRQECCSGLPCPPPGHLPHPVTEPESPASSALTGGFVIT